MTDPELIRVLLESGLPGILVLVFGFFGGRLVEKIAVTGFTLQIRLHPDDVRELSKGIADALKPSLRKEETHEGNRQG